MRRATAKQRYYFDDDSTRLLLLGETDSWIGTPFMEYGEARGVGGGVDCNGLVYQVYFATGLSGGSEFTFPHVPMDWCRHNDRSIVLEWLRGEAGPKSKAVAKLFHEVWNSDARNGHVPGVMVGDLLAFKIGRCVHHLAIATSSEGSLVHALRGHGVIRGELRDSTWHARLHNIFRPVAR